MNVRPYRESDQVVILKLWNDCNLLVGHNDPVKDIHRKLKVNPEWFLVGEIDGKLMASCMAGYEGHRGWINYLAVAPEYQRGGYAREIMARAEELLRQAGCPKINLQIRSGNTKVIEFYHRIGFKVDDVVSMGKRLEEDKSS